MNTGNNQEWALARWREDAAKNDPPLYSVRNMLDRAFMWLRIGGNVGWYAPEIKMGNLVGVRSIALPQPWDGETEEDHKSYNHNFDLISPKQRRKIERIMEAK